MNVQKDLPVISVIVPVYNAETTIIECVNSICANHYQALEIILIDDGSTDASGAICDTLAASDARIKVIHKNNEGVGIARNTGMESATGDYVMFVDADDTVSELIYEKMVRQVAIENADCVVCAAIYIYTNVRKERTPLSHIFGSQSILGREEIDRRIVHPLITPGHTDAALMQSVWNKLYRASVIRENGLSFSRLPYAEDWLFNIEFFLKAGKVSFLEDPLYFYNASTPGSLSRSWRKDSFQNTVWIQNRLARLFPKKYTQDDLYLSVLGIQEECLKNYAYYCGIQGFLAYALSLFHDNDLIRAYQNVVVIPVKYCFAEKCIRHSWCKLYCLWCLLVAKTVLAKHGIKSVYFRFKNCRKG